MEFKLSVEAYSEKLLTGLDLGD